MEPDNFQNEIKRDIVKLKTVMKNIQIQLEILENNSFRNMMQTDELMNRSSIIIDQGNIMKAHITFIETVYESIKKPFHWLMNKVNQLHDKYIENKNYTPLMEMNGKNLIADDSDEEYFSYLK